MLEEEGKVKIDALFCVRAVHAAVFQRGELKGLSRVKAATEGEIVESSSDNLARFIFVVD